MTHQTEWPDGVIARYLTPGGATVDVTAATDGRARHHCNGCGHGEDIPRLAIHSRRDAQNHASFCRAMPRPGGAQ